MALEVDGNMIADHFNRDFNVIYLRVVQGCNLNCSHCFTLGNRDAFKLADLNQVSKFLKVLKAKLDPKGAVFYIHGGEPFMAPYDYLAKVNTLIRENFIGTKLNIVPQTNLMYEVDSKYVEFLKSEYSGHIGVSWDHGIRFGSTTGALNEDLFLKNFKFLVSQGIEMAVAITVQKKLLELSPIDVVKKLAGATSIDFEFLTMFDEKTKNMKVSNTDWAVFYDEMVRFYANNDTSWSLPQVDLMTKSFLENRIYQCKCNCCQNRTFTMNCNGTVGLCPDETYFAPISTVNEMASDWDAFRKKAEVAYMKQLNEVYNPVCNQCEHFELCGGNCELSLFNENENECPLSKNTISYQLNNLSIFKDKLDIAKNNLIELRQRIPECH